MTPLPVYIIPRRFVEMLCGSPPIPQADLDNYLSLRPGILDDGKCDIFCENSRSVRQRWKNFSLFHVSPAIDNTTLIVLPFFLELFLAFGCREKIATCIDWLKTTYPENPVAVQWNHDLPSEEVPELQDLPGNFFVLQFNTSRPTRNDILLPFWTIETNIDWEPAAPRKYRGGFIGFSTSTLAARHAIMGAFGRPGWHLHNTTKSGTLPKTEYLSRMLEWDFALCPRGGGLGSYRVYEAINCGCIPLIFADAAALPYPDLDWSSFSFRIPESDAGHFERICDLIGDVDVTEMRRRLLEVRPRFSLAGVQLEIARRISEHLCRNL